MEAARSWDHASPTKAKLSLEAKSSIFQMLKLWESLGARMAPPPDAGCPPWGGSYRAFRFSLNPDVPGTWSGSLLPQALLRLTRPEISCRKNFITSKSYL